MRQRRISKGRLLRDRTQLLGALHDHRRGKTSHLADTELAFLIENIERRLATLDAKLQELDGA